MPLPSLQLECVGAFRPSGRYAPLPDCRRRSLSSVVPSFFSLVFICSSRKMNLHDFMPASQTLSRLYHIWHPRNIFSILYWVKYLPYLFNQEQFSDYNPNSIFYIWFEETRLPLIVQCHTAISIHLCQLLCEHILCYCLRVGPLA